MKAKKTIKQGLWLAIGVFVSNLVLVPIISGGGVASGVPTGFIGAALVLTVYFLLAMPEWKKKSDAQET